MTNGSEDVNAPPQVQLPVGEHLAASWNRVPSEDASTTGQVLNSSRSPRMQGKSRWMLARSVCLRTVKGSQAHETDLVDPVRI